MMGESRYQMRPLKHGVCLRRGRAEDDANSRPYVGLEHIESGTGRLLGATEPSETPSDNEAATQQAGIFEPGDVLFGKLRPYLAKAWVADFSGRCTTELLAMTPESFDAAFLRYICISPGFVIEVDSSTFGSKMPRAEWGFIGGCKVPCPSLPRQRAIVAYLDRETAKIDAMIAAKERLLTLLAEKRRALITHAVTRGLNPDAPTKDSGVEWLGEIPDHWTLTRLKFLAEIRGGVTLGKSYGNKPLIEVPYLRVANVQVGRVNLDEVKNISVPVEERDRYLLRAGDLLMTEGGDIDKLGRGCVWREQVNPCIHQNHVFSVRPHDVNPEWLARWTDAEPSRAYFEITAKRSTNLASISGSNIGELPVLVPPDVEMVQILSHIAHGMGQLDALSEHAESTIHLLRERRSAVIAAAVTGELDVEDAA